MYNGHVTPVGFGERKRAKNPKKLYNRTEYFDILSVLSLYLYELQTAKSQSLLAHSVQKHRK